MSTIFVLIHLAALGFAIFYLVKFIKAKKAGSTDANNPKVKMIGAIVVWIVAFFLIGITAPDTKETTEDVASDASTEASIEEVEVKEEVATEASTETQPATTPEPEEFEVTIDATAKWDGNSVKFEINTNLPNDTELMLSLRSGDYNTDSNWTGQTKVKISDGKAESEGFSNKGEKLSGDYDLDVSMSLPRLQADSVRAVIGENGEYMTGPLVEKSSIGESNVVSALFAVSLADDITITAETDYTNTTFREDDENSASSEEAESILDQYASADEETQKVAKKIQEYIDANYTYTTLDKITVNPNLGTDKEDDYIALVYLTWDQMNKGDTSKKMLDMYSSDMAVHVYEDMPEIQELAVFWTVPYLNNGSAKISFERKSNGMAYTDTVFDKNFD